MRSFVLSILAAAVLAGGFAVVLDRFQETAMSYRTEGARP